MLCDGYLEGRLDNLTPQKKEKKKYVDVTVKIEEVAPVTYLRFDTLTDNTIKERHLVDLETKWYCLVEVFKKKQKKKTLKVHLLAFSEAFSCISWSSSGEGRHHSHDLPVIYDHSRSCIVKMTHDN